MSRFLLTLGAALAASGAYADTAVRPFASPTAVDAVTPAGVGSLGQVTLSLGLVLAVIFAAAWVVRKSRVFGKAASGALDVVANLPLGQKERAVLIRVGDTQILLGVAPGRVSMLHVLTTPVATTPDANVAAQELGSAQRPNFKSLLLRSLGKS
jgi:flagellar protein FliO/FliZ